MQNKGAAKHIRAKPLVSLFIEYNESINSVNVISVPGTAGIGI